MAKDRVQFVVGSFAPHNNLKVSFARFMAMRPCEYSFLNIRAHHYLYYVKAIMPTPSGVEGDKK